MREIAKFATVFVLTMSCVLFVYARLRFFRGEPWEASSSGRGEYSVEYGSRARSTCLTLDGDGLCIERNPSPYSFDGDGGKTWTVMRIDRPSWNWCGTGMDDYSERSSFSRFGLTWKCGTWTSYAAARRPHLRIVSPHWLNASVSGLFPVVFLYRRARRAFRYAEGCCASCGYDLRATPHRCPECGTIVPLEEK